MSHSLKRIFQRMSKVIHWINAPFISCIMMFHPCDAIKNRIPHIHISGCHIDLRPQHFASIRIFSCFHILEQLKILFRCAVTIWAVLSRFRQSSSVFTNFIRRQITYIRLSFLNQKFSAFIHFIKIIRRKIDWPIVFGSQPFHIFFD